MVGGSYVERNLKSLALDGRLVQIAMITGNRPEVDLGRLMRNRLTITGSTLRPRTIAEKAAIAVALREHVWPLLESGRVRPIIYKTFALQDVQEAHRELERGQHIGKIVLLVDPQSA
jgi:NADPH:quinone reductase-like Zn-dependent oxidoreductase